MVHLQRHMTLALLAFLLALVPVDARAESVGAIYKKGQKLFLQKKYTQALLHFRQATEADPQHAASHYGLARSLAALRAQGQTCEHGAYRSVIMRHLFKACRLDGKLKRRIKRDKVLKPIHDTFAFQQLLGRRIGPTEDVKKILRAVSWYGPASGAHGPGSGLRFSARGRVTLWVLDVSGEQPRRVKHPGSWRVRRNRVFLLLDKPLGEVREVEGELKQTGELWLPGLPGPFNDDPSDCSR